MIEALLLTACLSTPESCSPGFKAYYRGQPQIRQFVRETRKASTKYFGEWLTYGAPIIIAAARGAPSQVRIWGPLSLQIKPDVATLNLDYSF
jgi:hypothetical protein